MYEPTSKQQQVLDNFVFQGMVLKAVSQAIAPLMDRELNGLAAKVVSEDHAVIYRLRYDNEEITGGPFLEWKGGKVERRSGRRVKLSYVVPNGRKQAQGLFMTSSNKILVGLRS